MQLEKKKNNGKKMERKKFFYSLGLGFMGAFAAKNIVLSMFTKREKIKSKKVVKNSRVKINPLAVSRNKTGADNG